MKIVQISDVHIRNLKYHDEYRRVFSNLYEQIQIIKPDFVVNTGDTAHTKTQISPEFVEMTSDHIKAILELSEYHIILGNHDLNLMNLDRQDAISPIIESINSPRVHFHKKSGRVNFAPGFNFWVFSLADEENYPRPSHWAQFPDDVNIGLFHGSVSTCVTDSNWRMTHVEHDLSIFDGLDYAFLGDIHKQQFFNDRRIAYAGSLIQQNFGEELDKGFLFWEIEDKKNFQVTPIHLKGSRKFHTIKLSEDLSIPDTIIEEGSRIRISPPRQITLVEQKEVEKNVKKRFKPHDVITLSATNIGEQKVNVGKKISDMENLRQISVQERLIREFLKDKNLSEKIMSKILDMNRRFQISIDQSDEGARNVSWKINRIGWNNLFNYGEGNIIDFTQLGGLTGLFAPNASGKSNLIDVLMETCFDSVTKGVSKNIFLINDNKDVATSIAEITANDQNYEIVRNVERIKYGQRSRDQLKEWGKTSVSFALVDDAGGKEPLVGTTRPETERNIRQRVGTFDDFMLTSLSAQWNPMDIISCKETKRKEIIYRFLDLEIFGQKAIMAKDESRDHNRKLADLEDNGLEDTAKRLQYSISLRKKEIQGITEKVTEQERLAKELDGKVDYLNSQKISVNKVSRKNWGVIIPELDRDLAANAAELADIQKKMDEVQTRIGKIEKLEERFVVADYQAKVDELESLDAQFCENDLKIKDLEKKLKDIQKRSKLLAEVPCGNSFPSCKFLVDAFESRTQIPSVETQLQSLKDVVAEITTKRTSLLPFKEKLDQFFNFITEKDTLNSKRDNLKLKLENLKLKGDNLSANKENVLKEKAIFEQQEHDLRKNEDIETEVMELRSRKTKIVSEIKRLQSGIVEETRLLGSDQGIMEKISAQLDTLQELRDICSAYEHYISAMGKDGIAYQILTQKLPLINEEINKILSNAADFSIFLEHDAEEQSIRFYIQYGEYKSRLLELGSGAEKFLASIAIRNALLSISILPKTNMFIIDEGFGKLDPKNLEAVQRMFDYLKTVFDHVIVISHLDTLKDLVDNIIDITTDEEGYAHIEIGA